MKNKTFLTALCASAFGFAATNSSEAALLFGFNVFNGTMNSETADHGVFKNQSTVTKAVASSSTGGSSDGQFGGSQWSTLTGTLNGTPGTGGTGYLNITSSPTIFSITNTSGSIYELESLLFDFSRAITVPSNNTVNSTFSIEIDDGYGALAYDTQTVRNFQSTANEGNDYPDYTSFDIFGTLLSPGQTMQFIFTGDQADMRIDNIALTGNALAGIPETANFAALGGLLISGLAIRSRRRSASKA